MKLHYRGEPFPLDALRKELTEAGAEFLDLTNEWEVLRYRYGGKVGIVYRNKKGEANPTGAAGQHFAALRAGRPITMSSKEAKRLRPAAAKSDPRVSFNHRCDALAKAHSQTLHTERKAAARARADVMRAEMPSAPAS